MRASLFNIIACAFCLLMAGLHLLWGNPAWAPALLLFAFANGVCAAVTWGLRS